MRIPSLQDIDTPAVLVLEERLVRNIRAMQARADAAGLALRPHVKTHKCPEIAALQLGAGAVGLTAAKVDEALVFLDQGCPDLTLAYPLLAAEKLDRLLDGVTRAGARLRCIADAPEHADVLSAAAKRHATRIDALIKIDVGLHRCGLRENDPGLIPLARRFAEDGDAGLRFAGILSHAGHAYGATGEAEALRIAREEAVIMGRVKARLVDAGLPVPTVSVGATPTALALGDFSELKRAGVTELRPGNYVFLDRGALRLGLAGLEDIALFALATVVSANKDSLILDAGAKTLGLDLGAHGFGAAEYGYGLAFFSTNGQDFIFEDKPARIARLSEEHGVVERDGREIRLGTRALLVPNHSCAVANLAERLLLVRADGAMERPLFWNVAARAKVR
jgi:D-serine deaminase-like pyridoxal phosphate-dependent protein